jgi:hypothetical protein
MAWLRIACVLALAAAVHGCERARSTGGGAYVKHR